MFSFRTKGHSPLKQTINPSYPQMNWLKNKKYLKVLLINDLKFYKWQRQGVFHRHT